MAIHSHVQVPPDSTGKKIDNVVVDTDKFRQVTATGDAENLAAIQRVKDTAAAADDQAAVVRASSLGEQADAAVITDAVGSISAKLRGLVKWAFERMPASLGSKVSAESLPVVVALDQPRIGVWVASSAGFLGSLASDGETGGFALDGNATASIYLNISNLTGTLEVQGSDGGVRFYPVPFFDGTTARLNKAFVAATQEETWHLILPAGTTMFKVVMSGHSDGSVDLEGAVAATAPTVQSWLGSVAPTVGQKAMAESIPVTMASDQPALPEVVTNTGTMSATNDPVTIALNGHTGVGARVVASGTFAGLVVMEATMNGVNYFTIPFVVVASGGVVQGATFVGGLYLGTSDHHFSALLPAGITHVRIRLSTVSAGTVTTVINGTSQLDFSPRSLGAFTQDPGPNQAQQIGGTAAAGGVGQFQFAQVRNVNPGISSGAYGIVTVPWGLVDPGGSAGGYPFRLVAGRDPTSNATRQLDLIPGPITSTAWNGLVVRPYMGSDGTNMMPTMDAYARRGYMEPVKATTGAAPAAATVGVTSAAAVSANASRKGLILTNTSPNVISLSFDAAAVLYSGITLQPGATFTMDENCFDAGEVRAIASAASSNLSIQEFT